MNFPHSIHDSDGIKVKRTLKSILSLGSIRVKKYGIIIMKQLNH